MVNNMTPEEALDLFYSLGDDLTYSEGKRVNYCWSRIGNDQLERYCCAVSAAKVYEREARKEEKINFKKLREAAHLYWKAGIAAYFQGFSAAALRCKIKAYGLFTKLPTQESSIKQEENEGAEKTEKLTLEKRFDLLEFEIVEIIKSSSKKKLNIEVPNVDFVVKFMKSEI